MLIVSEFVKNRTDCQLFEFSQLITTQSATLFLAITSVSWSIYLIFVTFETGLEHRTDKLQNL